MGLIFTGNLYTDACKYIKTTIETLNPDKEMPVLNDAYILVEEACMYADKYIDHLKREEKNYD